VDVFLARHAESTWNAEDRWQGQADVPLSMRGLAQADALGARLDGVAFDLRITSDLARARQTSAAIGGGFAEDPAWREIDLGRWSGLLHTEVSERWPDEVRALAEGTDLALGGGESLPRFEARVLEALASVRARTPENGRALTVTHGGVIRAIVMHLLGLRRGRPLVGAGNTALCHLRFEASGGGVLVGYNCAAHLERRDPPGVEAWTGPPDEVKARLAEHLSLEPRGTSALAPPSDGHETRIVHRGGVRQLLSYALPVRFDPRSD
jgi:probable phosphoglycerate mutase